jgi:carbonic anhydrase
MAVSSVMAAGAGWEYKYDNNGADWASIHPPAGEINYCATDSDNQSPINLLDPLGSYGWAYDLPLPKVHDKHEKSYTDI